jgi:2-polyprenyl-3-methyl-5-hydroxy-6-metoxy-1,4-benzoquinol methylase
MFCKDYTVSRETFSIVECCSCGFRFTNPRPEENKLGDYYKSEDYVSHSNTSKGLINNLYQRVRKHTIKGKLKLIGSYSKRGSVLDVGCGTGEFLHTCKVDGWEVMGIEPSEDAREMAIKNYALDVRKEESILSLEKESFDIITLWHVLEHVPHLQERVGELMRLLKSDGTIFIAVPNCASSDAKHYGEYWSAYDVPRHLYHFRPEDIKHLFQDRGMRVERVLPMKFDSFYVSMLSEKYMSGSTNPIKSFFNGLTSNLRAMSSGETYSSQIYVIRK